MTLFVATVFMHARTPAKIRTASADESRILKTKTKLRGLSPHANYTDRAAAAGRRS